MQFITLIIILICCTKCIVNDSGMSKIDLKILNATCGGKNCDNYTFKICYSVYSGGKPKCLQLYDKLSPEFVVYQRVETVLTPLEGISLTVLPFTFIIYINDETIYDKPENRPQNGTHMVLTFISDTGTRSFFQIGLTSDCYDEDHCSGFLCQNCFTKPPIVTVPHSKAGLIGGNLTIPCNVSEVYRETVITWIKNNGSFDTIINIDDSERFVGGTYNIPDLTIMSAQKEDEGNYTCQAQNLEFKGSSLPVYLSIFEYPVVNVSNIEPAIEGTNITIPCYVSASSKVTKIFWYKNNSILDIYGNDRYSGGKISSPSLEIYFVKEYDGGNYTCQAMNPVATNESIPTHLTILPDIPKVHISIIEAVNVGENVIISCNISSVSELTKVVWSKNNIEFNLNANRTEDDDRFSGGTLQDPSLTINSVQITDEGNFTCNATNSAEQTGWSKPVYLTVFEATTESLPSTDLMFSTSELSTSSSDIISTDLIFPTSKSTTLISNTTSSTIATTKTSTVPSSVKTTITTTSAKVQSTISPNSSPTVNMSTTTSSTLSSTSKSTTSPSSSKSPSTVMSTVRPTTIHKSVSFSRKLPNHTIRSKPSTKIPYRSSTVKTSSTTSSTVKTSTTTSSIVKTSTTTSPTVITSTLTSSTSKYPVSPSSAVGSTGNRENLNAWVITTTVICVVEFIVIVLVVYILWLRKQRRLALQYEKEETAF